MSEIYVCFNDSVTDPTYNSASDSYLVVPNSNGYEDMNENPCSPKNIYRKVPVIPNTLKELRDFCDVVGWEFDFDSDGQVILLTGITE